MSAFVLKKGTTLRHGTSLLRLQGILEHGLVPGFQRDAGRASIELPPETHGIYVGTLAAYFGAYAAYSAEVAPYWTMPNMMKAAFVAGTTPIRLRDIEGLPAAPCTLPVVINIVLQEDRTLIADEDFVHDGAMPIGKAIPREMLETEAEGVWKKWGSGVLVAPIPSSWFASVEHPRLSNLDGSHDIHKQTFADCSLFVGGLLQASNKELPSPLIEQFKAQFGDFGLSQKIAATPAASIALADHKSLADNAGRWFNHFRLVQMMDEMAQRYGIRTAQFDSERATMPAHAT